MLGWAVVAALEIGLFALIAAWLIGRVYSDRALWSQYLGWIPTEAVVGVGSVLAAGVFVIGRGRRRLVPGFAVVILLGWLLIGEWRVYRWVMPSPPRGDIRVVFMNISPKGGKGDLGPVFESDADIVVLSNVHPQRITFEKIYGFPPEQLLERTVGIVPGESPPGEIHMLRYGGFHVYSRHTIRKRASAHIGNQETWLDGDVLGGGGVLMLEIDAPGGPLVLWVVDMPRTLGASRRLLFEQMGARIDKISKLLTIGDMGRWKLEDADENDLLFTPDLVVGDFNTPARAWSLTRLEPGLRNVRSDAGAGPGGTFPAEFPLFEIDLARLGTDIEATRVGRIRCDGCRHLGIALELERGSSD